MAFGLGPWCCPPPSRRCSRRSGAARNRRSRPDIPQGATEESQPAREHQPARSHRCCSDGANKQPQPTAEPGERVRRAVFLSSALTGSRSALNTIPKAEVFLESLDPPWRVRLVPARAASGVAHAAATAAQAAAESELTDALITPACSADSPTAAAAPRLWRHQPGQSWRRLGQRLGRWWRLGRASLATGTVLEGLPWTWQTWAF